MSFGIETRDANGKLTFDLYAPVLKQEDLVYIPAYASGTIYLQGRLGGGATVRFIRSNFSMFDTSPIAPYAVYSGGNLTYQNHSQPHYAIILGVVR